MLGSIDEDEYGTVQVEENVDDKETIVISETEETFEVEKTAVVEGSVEDDVAIVSNNFFSRRKILYMKLRSHDITVHKINVK